MSRLIAELKSDTETSLEFLDERFGLIDYALHLITNRPWRLITIVRTIQRARYGAQQSQLYLASATEIEQRIQGFYAIRH
jgi:hypothetical protein